MDASIIDSIVHGLVEPQIYAFLTKTVPRFIKVGDTYRPVNVRIGEWRDKGFPIDDSDVKKWSATLGEGRFFRDYSVHEYLKDIAGMSNLSRAELLKLSGTPTAPYSNEFFRFAKEDDSASTTIAIASANVDLAIDDIRKYDSHKVHSQLTYTVYDVTANARAAAPIRTEKNPRDNQKEAVNRFRAATAHMSSDGKTLLMYAVMRFGKTFTSLLCAKEMNGGAGADLVVVVSAKKDVGSEWADEVKFTENFKDYFFLDADNLKRNDDVIHHIESKSKKFVIFLTLQTFLKKKKWLEQLFKAKIDLLIVDETHFGARAPRLGGILRGDEKEDKAKKHLREDEDFDDDVKEAPSVEKEMESVCALSLNAQVRLHLSGTPYRILMRGEFAKENIIAFCQYSDIIDAQEAWNKNCLGHVNPKTGREYAEWENPYFGFPQQVRFAFNPNPSAIRLLERLRSEGRTCRIADVFLPEQDTDGNFTGTFAHPDEVGEFLRILDGSDEGESEGFLSLLNYPRIKEGKLCQHVVMVLPRMASCDAMAAALASGSFTTLSQYHILNISGHNRPAKYDDPEKVKDDIKEYAEKGEKTITLTVNRMLTGSTVREWDTMIFLKDTKSPQEYDQAIFRLQSPYVQSIPDASGSGDVIRRNLKPQTLLVDFDPGRMFAMQELKGQIYNANVGEKGMEKLQERIARELEVSPIIFFNKDKLRKAEYIDVVNEVLAYTGTRGIAEEVSELDVDLDLLDADPTLLAAVRRENPLFSKNGFETKAAKGDGADYGDPTGGEGSDGQNDNGGNNSGESGDSSDNDNSDKATKDLASRFRAYYRRILFYAFLARTSDEIGTLRELVDSIRGVENTRIAEHLGIEKSEIKRLLKLRHGVLESFELAIRRKNRLGRNTIGDVAGILIAIRGFDRFSASEVVTPEAVADEMLNAIPNEEFAAILDGKGLFLDIAGKCGEFAAAIVRRAKALRPACDLSRRICTIPTSLPAYEFTRKVYDVLGLDSDCVATFTAYDLLEKVKSDGLKTITPILNQKKPFWKITMSDTPATKPHPRFALVVGNPPYQEETAKRKSETNGQAPRQNIFHYFQMIADEISSSKTSLIYPGGRWIHRSGKNLEEFGKDQINDPHLSAIYFWPNSQEVFPSSVAIDGGVSIVVKDKAKTSTDFRYVFRKEGKTIECTMPPPGEKLMPLNPQDGSILDAVRAFCSTHSLGSLHDRIFPRSFFGIESEFVALNPSLVKPYEETMNYDWSCQTKLLTNDKAGKAGRAKWFIVDRSTITENNAAIDLWKVVVSSANAGGQKRDWQLEILDNHSAFGRSRVALAMFPTKSEAEDFKQYCLSPVIRFLFRMTDEALTSLAKEVPDFHGLKGRLDFDKDLNGQLCSLFGLNDDQVTYIASVIEEVDASRGSTTNTVMPPQNGKSSGT